jgi:hypothetical protein
MTLSNLSIFVIFVDNVMPSLSTTKAYSGAHRSGNNNEEHTCSSYIVKSNNGSKRVKSYNQIKMCICMEYGG